MHHVRRAARGPPQVLLVDHITHAAADTASAGSTYKRLWSPVHKSFAYSQVRHAMNVTSGRRTPRTEPRRSPTTTRLCTRLLMLTLLQLEQDRTVYSRFYLDIAVEQLGPRFYIVYLLQYIQLSIQSFEYRLGTD